MAETAKQEKPRKEYYTGNWNGKQVRFNRNWNGHRLTDGECDALCNGDAVTFQAVSRKGKTYQARGMLAEQTFNGKKFVGFSLCMVPECVFIYDEAKMAKTPRGTGPLTQDEDDLFTMPVGSGRQDSKKQQSVKTTMPPGMSRTEPYSEAGHRVGMPGRESHSYQGYMPDMNVGDGASVSAASRAAGIAKTVAKGAVTAGAVGLLAAGAGTVSAVKKSKKKTDELLDRLADDTGFAMGQLFAGNAWEQRAVQKAIQDVTGKPAPPMPARRLPDLPPMAPAKDDEMELD